MQSRPSRFLSHIGLSDGTAEALKFLGLLLMSIDHVNGFLLSERLPALSLLGRLAFPIFAYVLGRNLARPGLIESGAASRMLKRLLLFAALATLPYVYLLNMKWSQLNILYTLFCGSAMVVLLQKGRPLQLLLAAALFLAAGPFVDYMWPGLLLCVTSWHYCKTRSQSAFLLWLAALASLYFINQNFAALLVVPLLWLASQRSIAFPRYRHFFYWFYPLHLALIGYLANR